MMNDNILDDNLDNIDKPFVRTQRIQQVETGVIVCSIVSLILQILNIISYGIFSFIFLGGIVVQLTIFAALMWWRKISIEFDANTTTTRIIEPNLLTSMRVVIPLYSGWVLFSSLFGAYFLFKYSFRENILEMDWSAYILRVLLNFSIAFLYIYYWRITKQSMDFINK